MDLSTLVADCIVVVTHILMSHTVVVNHTVMIHSVVNHAVVADCIVMVILTVEADLWQIVQT